MAYRVSNCRLFTKLIHLPPYHDGKKLKCLHTDNELRGSS